MFLLIMSSIVIQLGSGVLKELLSSTGVAPEEVNEVILGQVGSKLKRRVPNRKQNPKRVSFEYSSSSLQSESISV